MLFPNERKTENTREAQTLVGMRDNITVREDYVDLRLLEDDKTVLKNPHKGWFWHFIDNGLRRPAYRDQIEPGDYLEDFPGMNHLYLRFDWSDIEKEKGKYDWTPLDSIMEEWGPHGYTFSMRACTYEAASFNATPDYVFEEGAVCYRTPGGALQPDYADPIFLSRLEAFMEAFGSKYNGDKRLEMVDIGTYGTWGEGHTVHGDEKIYPIPVVKHHIDLHTRYFPDTFLLLNDDHIVGRTLHGQEEVSDMLAYAEARGLGLQDDSICIYEDEGYNTARAEWAFKRLAKYAPNCIELQHYREIPDNLFREGLTAVEAFCDVQATFAGFHGYPRPWLEMHPYLTEYCANRLGYWFFVPYLRVRPLQNTAHNTIRVGLENRGWAKAYHKSAVQLRLKGESGTYVLPTEIDLRALGPGEKNEFAVPMDLRRVVPGNYALQIGVFEDQRAVKLALRNCSDGDWYSLTEVTVAGI